MTESNPKPSYPEWEEIEEGYNFIPGKIFFEELFVGISIKDGDEWNESISKVIVISPDGPSDISGEITFTPDLEDDLAYTLNVKNASTGFSNGFIESYEWSIEEKTYTINGDFNTPDISPDIEHVFSSFWEQEIQVKLTDSTGKTEILKKTITIAKNVELRSPLIIRDSDGNEIEELRYEKNTHEYFIDSLWIPSKGSGKSYSYFVPTEGNHTIVAEYIFVHRKNSEDTISLKEYIYIEWVKKDAILKLKMEFDTNYAPVTVRFDASESFIKNDDIVKFIYDYGDGISEERDAINPGHKYSEAGDYNVTLTVVGKSGKRYSTSKQLILLPPAQWVKISSSLKRAPTEQWIDFSSSDSSGQIIEYFWDFWDGNISTEANPTHSYKNTWIYKVSLKADFANNNSLSDEVEIEVFDEE